MSQEKIMRWHHELANITGSLSLRITKQALSREELRKWIAAMRKVANEMEEMTK